MYAMNIESIESISAGIDEYVAHKANGPDTSFWRIEMRSEGGWAKLGGIYSSASLADERIDQFREHFMCITNRNSANRECRREFRRLPVDRNGNPV